MSTLPAVVLVTTSFPVQGDGSEAAGGFVADLALALALHRPVRVVAPGPVVRREAWAEGVEVFRYAAPDRPLSTLKPWHPGDLLAIRRVLAGGQRATREAVESGPTAHLLALWALPCGHWARRVARSAGLPYSVWTLGSDIWTLGRIPLVRGYLRRVLRDARACYADGLALAEDTRRIGECEVAFLPSTRAIGGVRSHPPRNASPYRLAFLGRWHPNKGVDLLMQALTKLDDADWALVASFDIAGGGPLAADVARQVGTLRSLGRPVCLEGFLDKTAAAERIAAADYLVIPSRVESIPVVFSDALKLGTPVLTTPVGDLADLVHRHHCGLVADAATMPAIAAMIQGALRTSAQRFAPGVAAAARIFDLEHIALSLHRSMAAGARSSG